MELVHDRELWAAISKLMSNMLYISPDDAILIHLHRKVDIRVIFILPPLGLAMRSYHHL